MLLSGGLFGKNVKMRAIAASMINENYILTIL